MSEPFVFLLYRLSGLFGILLAIALINISAWRKRKRRRREQEEVSARMRAELSVQSSSAEVTAEINLLRFLNPHQIYTWVIQGFIEIEGSESGKIYTIRKPRPADNSWCSITSPDGRYCAWFPTINPSFGFSPVPIGDDALGKILIIKTDEQYFLREANRI